MTNQEVFDLVKYILNEEESGNALSPEEFNILLNASSWELTRQIFRVYEEGQEVTDAIQRFKSDTALTFVSGEADLPANYYRKSYMTADGIWVEFCDDYEFGYRQTRQLTKPDHKYPIARIKSNSIEINPADITSATLYYLRHPNEPFYDYYYDSNGRIVFMPENKVLDVDEEYRDGTEGDGETEIESNNVDLDWNTNEILIAVSMICSKAGINLKEGQVIEYSELMKQQKS